MITLFVCLTIRARQSALPTLKHSIYVCSPKYIYYSLLIYLLLTIFVLGPFGCYSMNSIKHIFQELLLYFFVCCGFMVFLNFFYCIRVYV